jgi:hypothetical protein
MMSVRPKSFGVNTRADALLAQPRASLSGMIPPTTTGTSSSPASRRPAQHRGHDLQVRAGQHRQARRRGTSSSTAADTICAGVSRMPW